MSSCRTSSSPPSSSSSNKPPLPDDETDEAALAAVAAEHVMVPMRDGVRISAYVFTPQGEGPWPALLQQVYVNTEGRHG